MDRKERTLYSRREFGKLALAAVPAVGILADSKMLFAQAKPNSVFGGVRVGVIAPYSFNVETPDVDAILKALIKDNISEVELQNSAVEAYAGAPAPPARGARAGGAAPAAGAAPAGGAAPAAGGAAGRAGAPAPARGRAAQTPEQIAAQRDFDTKMSVWRMGVPMSKFEALRKMYNDAGVRIDAYRITLTDEMLDDEFDYCFNAARALGADQVTMELPDIMGVPSNVHLALTKRIGAFAAKHKIAAGYHAHLQSTPTLWDVAMGQSPYNKAQIDIGHYTAAKNGGPTTLLALIRRHHDQIASIHLKDRKVNEGPNVPWGQGDTPIKQVLQLMKTEKYTFPAFIELEYPVPEGSTRIAEVAKCIAYAKAALA